ncbi:hypothetical protein [Enterococcus casseliflavus]|uniref:hypothetical protein n=1 Tax=Enterococcus casseliflavus TaxID=37734 RepID=UPI003D0AAE36
MNAKKETKKELRKYLSLVAYCHEEHRSFNHKLGKDPDCLSCENYKKLTAYVKILEKKLAAYRGQETIDVVEKQVKKRASHQKSETESGLFLGNIEGKECIIRSKSLDRARKDYPYFEGRLLTNDEANALYVEIGPDSYCQLPKVSEKKRGIIARKGTYAHEKKCRYRYTDEYLVYTGENHQQVIDFCVGSEAFKTKKKNKMQINLSKGSISAAPGEYLVRNRLNHIAIYSPEEFEQLIEPVIIDVWKKI